MAKGLYRAARCRDRARGLEDAMTQVERLSEPDERDLGPLRARPTAPMAPEHEDLAPGVRRLEQTVVSIDPKSVLRLSLTFYRWLVLGGFALGFLIWLGAFLTGSTGAFDSFAQDITGYPSPTVLGLKGLLVAIVLGLTFVLGGTFAAVLGASLFNMVSDVGGGIRMTVEEEELDEPVPERRRTRSTGGRRSGSDGPVPLRAPPSERPVLGADVTRIDTPDDVAGALVVGTAAGSPAQTAGLVPGDVVISLGGEPVDSPSTLSAAIAALGSEGMVDLRWVDTEGRLRHALVHLSDSSI